DTFMQKQLQWTRHLVDKGRSDTVKITAPVTPLCPVCKGPTRKRKGKNGDFWGCIRYPECSGIIAGKNGGKGRKTARGKKPTAKTKAEFSAPQ
ncbi:topoisomerase DNA-binding C4 zinc finger domain-containing protein, partial [Salmonella enterica subsp. enterica serovar Derby]|nr:topoisomerase DNA-binding C4 zinc finger domain-containing protein [Salmonella enterica subsp. enterica serovar Derby]